MYQTLQALVLRRKIFQRKTHAFCVFFCGQNAKPPSTYGTYCTYCTDLEVRRHHVFLIFYCLKRIMTEASFVLVSSLPATRSKAAGGASILNFKFKQRGNNLKSKFKQRGNNLKSWTAFKLLMRVHLDKEKDRQNQIVRGAKIGSFSVPFCSVRSRGWLF